MKLKDKNILVTGGAGFIGSHLVDELVEIGANVIVVDNLKDGTLENLKESIDRIKFYDTDVRDYQRIKEILESHSVEVVFHLAANANVPYSVKHPEYDFETNAVGTFNILKASLDTDVKKVIYASSAAVYGEPEYTPIDEKHPLNPISPYGASKLAGERLGFAYYKTYGLPFVAMRIFNTYGPRQRRYVMYDLIQKLKRNPKELEVLGTGEQVRDYCYVKDTVRAFILAAESSKSTGEAYNIAGGNPISIKELVDLILEVMGLKGITKVHYTGQSWKGDIKTLIADISKIKKDLGFKPKYALKDGIRDLLNYLLELEV
ncbi:SDR family NAD(P)-dependent oxidoreductase [Pyrococcus kukulkanii]|uniref:SDR family NAD(P)-dependent oxidoreductase n=1 Tax=Pyrococcus kukulkanii TaxID=1609559 RepID=UPI00356288BF